MVKAKPMQRPAAPVVTFTDYEQGFLDCMKMVAGIIGGMNDEFRKTAMASGSSATTSHLAIAANNATNLLGSVRAEMDKAGLTHLGAKSAEKRGGGTP